MRGDRPRALVAVLNHAPLGIFAAVLALFGALSPSFLAPANLLNLLVQSASTVIVATGMTCVLLGAGVDLSVGSIMFVAAAVGGKLVLAWGWSVPAALAAMGAVSLAFGAANAFLVTRLGILAFVATLGTQYIGRGFGMWLTETRAMNLPESFAGLASRHALGIPMPLAVLGFVVGAVHLSLTRTPFGRQLQALGENAAAARKAGVNALAVIAGSYAISGLCAGIGSAVSLAQIGSVAPTFGANKEFAAIAAAVLGGTSLFGGRGQVFPGTVLGGILIQSVESGLNSLNADPYLYPLATGAIIFGAVLADSARTRWIARLGRRRIRNDEPDGAPRATV